jgi:hypothetical protein
MTGRVEGWIAAHPVLATLAVAALVAVVDVTVDVVALGEVSPGRTLLFVVAFTGLFVAFLHEKGYLDGVF